MCRSQGPSKQQKRLMKEQEEQIRMQKQEMAAERDRVATEAVDTERRRRGGGTAGAFMSAGQGGFGAPGGSLFNPRSR